MKVEKVFEKLFVERGSSSFLEKLTSWTVCRCDDGLGGMFADLGVAATLDCYVTAIRNNDDDDNNNPTAISHRNRRCRCVNFPPPRIHRRHVILFRRSEGETRTKTICGAGSSYVNEIN